MTEKLIQIQNMIYEVRGQKVMLDRDLAELYGVKTRIINQAVKRNIERFPASFMFQLNENEFTNWRSQIVISNEDKMGLRRPPFAFTEQGVSMLSAVLHTPTAIAISIRIMETFVAMRHFALSQSSTNEQITELRQLLMLHIKNSDYKFSEHDEAIKEIICALNNLIEKPKKTRKIGFHVND